MPEKMTCLQAYRTMIHLFDTLYFSTYHDDLGGYLGGPSIYSAEPGECPQTLDAAAWFDWMDAVKIVMRDDSATYDSVQFTKAEAYRAMHQYLVTYCDVGSDLTMKRLRDLTNQDVEQSELMQFLSTLWNQSLDLILQQDPHKKDGIFFSDTTCLDKRESFLVMQAFLDKICQHNDDQNLIRLVQDSRLKNKKDYWNSVPDVINHRIWQTWEQAVDQVLLHNPDTALNVLIAYKAMPIFLMNYFDDTRSEFIEKMIVDFQKQDSPESKKLLYWWTWIDAVNKVGAYQQAMTNNLISVKMQVSQDAALKIIKAWLQEYKELLGVDFVENVFSEELAAQLIAQQVLDTTQKAKQSYLLRDDEITILETYHVMLKLLEVCNKIIPEFQVYYENWASIDIYFMIDWIRISENIVRDTQ